MDSTWFEKRDRRDAAATAFAQRMLFQVVLVVAAVGFLVLVS